MDLTQPSRELDALVAEKVMGWTRYPIVHIAETVGALDFPETEETEMLLPPDFKRSDFEPPSDLTLKQACEWPLRAVPVLPNYSSDIAAAWLVVEKLEIPDPNYIEGVDEVQEKIKINAVIRLSDGRWMARFDNPASLEEYYERSTYSDSLFFMIADTAPLAICLAALKAVGALRTAE